MNSWHNRGCEVKRFPETFGGFGEFSLCGSSDNEKNFKFDAPKCKNHIKWSEFVHFFVQSCIQWKKKCNLCVQNFIFEGKRAWRFQEDRKLAHSQSKSITWRQEGRLLTLDTRREYWRYPATHTGLDSCAITRSWHYVFSAEFKYDLILLSLKRNLLEPRQTWRLLQQSRWGR